MRAGDNREQKKAASLTLRKAKSELKIDEERAKKEIHFLNRILHRWAKGKEENRKAWAQAMASVVTNGTGSGGVLFNTPSTLTSFIGRETEIGAVRALIQQHRLVTLVGSGGVGKTRLSLQVAADLVDELWMTINPKVVGGAAALTIVAGRELVEPAELELVSLAEGDGGYRRVLEKMGKGKDGKADA